MPVMLGPSFSQISNSVDLYLAWGVSPARSMGFGRSAEASCRTREVCRGTELQRRDCKAAALLLHGPLEAMCSIKKLHLCCRWDAKALLKASPLRHGAVDPSKLTRWDSSTSPRSPGPPCASKARLGFNSSSRDFRRA